MSIQIHSKMDFLKMFYILNMVFVVSINGMNLKSAYGLHEYLFTNHLSDIRPVHNDSQVTNVQVTVFLIHVFRLEEVTGELVTGMALSYSWFDEKVRWNPADFEGRFRTEIDVTKIWRPSLKLVSPSQKSERLGKEFDIAVISANGQVTISTNDIFYSSCAVQITYFPFDTQQCEIWFANPEYGKLLTFTPTSLAMDTSFFFENPIWQVEKTTLKVVETQYNYNFVCGIHIKRRATFYILNLLTPILILMVLNSMVFALPAESGERIGFSVTLLLSVAVYMTIIADKLPNSSKPSPILAYILVAYLSQSALICIKTILSLRMFYRDENSPVPKILSCIVKCCSSYSQSNKKNEVSYQHRIGVMWNEILGGQESVAEESEISWKTVAAIFDVIFLLSNIAICMLIAVVYFCIINLQPF